MLVLVRHGETTANAEGLLLGRSDVALTDRGRMQAAAVGSALEPAGRVISSPLRRALDTAAFLGAGIPIEVDPRWVEVDYGVFEGTPLTDVPAEVWTKWRSDPRFCPEGGESLASVKERVGAACEELFAADDLDARDPEEDVVVVSHVSPIKAAVAWALGADEQLSWSLHLSTGSITRLEWGHAGPVLRSFNLVP